MPDLRRERAHLVRCGCNDSADRGDRRKEDAPPRAEGGEERVNLLFAEIRVCCSDATDLGDDLR